MPIKTLFSLTVFFMFLNAQAAPVTVQVQSKVSSDRFDFGVGSKVKLIFGGNRANADAVFLGRMTKQNGAATDNLFLDLQKTRVYMVDVANTKFTSPVGKSQAILKPMDQVGGTCAAYAITHFWKQMYWSGYRGDASFTDTITTEEGRTKLLEETIGRYYMDHRMTMNSTMNNYGKRFGFNCKSSKFLTGAEAADFVYRKARDGKPVIMEFDIGPNMTESTYEVTDYENPTTPDPRLWIPRKTGMKNAGGHAIVAAAAFEVFGRKKIIVLDSDWTEPRIWDAERYMGAKTAMSSMGFYSCN
jgi:hypothetical protein